MALTLPAIEIQLLFVQVVEDGVNYVGRVVIPSESKAQNLSVLFGLRRLMDLGRSSQ